MELEGMDYLHDEMIVIDGHFDLLSDVAAKRKSGEIRVIESSYLPELKKGGVDIIVASIFVDSIYLPEMGLRKSMEQISALLEEIDESPDKLMLCKNAEDVRLSKGQGKVGFILSFEGAEPLGQDTMVLRAFYEMGVRGIGLVWSRRNKFADGCSFDGTGQKTGLSEAGIKLLQEAERLGMFIDVSHLSDEGLADVLKYSRKPFLASHSNARSLAGSMRNLTDEQIVILAEKGCVIGINAASIIAADTDEEATIGKLIDHIDHITKIAGINHVALGFDLCDQFMASFSEEIKRKMPRVPFDIIKGHGKMGEFLNALKERGYSDLEVKKIAGSNLIDFYKKVLD